MQQFVVPQFIDVEDKVLGPLSVRQFILLLIGAGVIFLLNRLMSFMGWIFATIFVLLLVFLFAFIKINGRPFHYFLLSLLQTYRRPQLKLWIKDVERYDVPRKKEKPKRNVYEAKEKAPLTTSRLAQVSLVVDTGGAYEHSDDQEQDDAVRQQKNVTEIDI